MCGIYGFLSPRQFEGRLLGKMGPSMFHRGPDDFGEFIDSPVALGHRRLSILDIEAGHQPIFNEDRTVVIVFNGEIYNYLELRETLIKAGHRFSTSSDTEVIVHLYEEYGEKCLERLSGMFAFAIWDSRKKELFAARDRFGIKPLVYYSDGEKFIFSSEIKGIIQYGGIDAGLDWEALGHYLSFNYIPAPRTIYSRIHKLEPGHCLKISQSNGLSVHVEKKRWYSLKDAASRDKGICSSLSDAAERLRHSLTDSVKRHMISDVPLGAFLSGGIDSSIIVGLMSRSSGKPVKTFSIGYKECAQFDETGYAREVADFNHTEHHEIKLGYGDILDIVPTVLDGLDEPFADWSIFPTYIVSRETGKFVKVALSGDGADEVFGGYRKYLGEYYYRLYSKVPSPVRHGLIEPAVRRMPDSFKSPMLDKVRQVKKFISGLDDYQPRRHYGWMRIFTDESIRKMLVPRCRAKIGTGSFDLIDGLYRDFSGDAVNKMLSVDISCCLPNDMLMKVDMMSMLNSIEVRVPFLDHKVIELAMNMSGDLKLRGRKRKFALVETFKDILPKSLHNRPKGGFDVPIGEWFKKEFKELFHDTLNEKTVRETGIFDFGFIDNMYSQHLSGRKDFSKELLSVFIFQWWFSRAKPSIS